MRNRNMSSCWTSSGIIAVRSQERAFENFILPYRNIKLTTGASLVPILALAQCTALLHADVNESKWLLISRSTHIRSTFDGLVSNHSGRSWSANGRNFAKAVRATVMEAQAKEREASLESSACISALAISTQ